MMKITTHVFLILLAVFAIKHNIANGSEVAPDDSADDTEVTSDDTEVASDDTEVKSDATAHKSVHIDEEKVEYARGSVCGYCTYCKFCKLCDKDCPCEQTKSKPNCHMCKYCKYCNLCSALCDTICTPGGILDGVSGAIVNSLPTFDKEEVDGDIASVKQWIEKKRDEL